MNSVLALLSEHPKDCIAIESSSTQLSYQELCDKIQALINWLDGLNIRSIALHAENSIDWIVLDLACQELNIVCTPIPLFFTDQQVGSVLTSAKPELYFTDQQNCSRNSHVIQCEFLSLWAERIYPSGSQNVPVNTSKITFTSGSTGQPKGVCLSLNNQMNVAKSLVEIVDLKRPRHLCLLPLPTLLENVAGVYAPLLAGGTVILPTSKERGFSGSQLIDPAKFIECIETNCPNTLILVPELLLVVLEACRNGWIPPSSLKFIAVGGSKCAASVIMAARHFGLPVFQGYGLSECASVVSLCSPSDDIESCGRVLSHLSVHTINKELVITGNTFLGYLEDPKSWAPKTLHTGDIGVLLDEKIYIKGRKKNMIINSFGRNISPEWVESELLATGLFRQTVLIGDARPFCLAIVVPIHSKISKSDLNECIKVVNQRLPDYAQVREIILSGLMTSHDGLYTTNMRPKRDAINRFFKAQIAQLYDKVSKQAQRIH